MVRITNINFSEAFKWIFYCFFLITSKYFKQINFCRYGKGLLFRAKKKKKLKDFFFCW